MQTVRPSRRQRERERHRDEILGAALRVLSARGMDGLTIEAVAREAEFAVGSLYRHFSSKEEMVESLFVHLTEPLFQEIEALSDASGSFADRLESWVTAALTHAKGEVPLLKLFFASSSGMPLPGSRLRDTRDRYFRAIDALVASGQAEGAVAKGERFHMDVCLFGMVTGYMRAAMWDEGPFVREAPAFVRRAFLEGFGGAPRATTPAKTGRGTRREQRSRRRG